MAMAIQQLQAHFPRPGRVEWIGLRPARRQPVQIVTGARLVEGLGLQGDRYQRRDGKRQVTLIQHEHLETVRVLCGLESLDPALLRRNLVISGIALLALKDKRFQIGDAVLEGTGLCHPCSRMEEVLGPGGYNGMRGHGGINARVLEGGEIALGSELRFVPVPGS